MPEEPKRDQALHPAEELGAAKTEEPAEGIAVASAQPLAFMPSLPPPDRQRPAAPESSAPVPAEESSPTARLSPLTLVAVALGSLVALSAVALGALLFQTARRAVSDPEPSASARPTERRLARTAEPTPPSSAAQRPESPPAPANAAVQAAPHEATPALVPKANEGLVAFQCSPPPCDSVWCGGVQVEMRHGAAILPAGRHVCKALKQGYRTQSQTFEVSAGERMTRTFVQTERKARPSGI